MALWNKKQSAPLSQKVEKQAPRLDMAEIGFTGLNIFSGQIFERFRRKLRNWDQAAKVYIEMRDVGPTIGAMFRLVFLSTKLFISAGWVPTKKTRRGVVGLTTGRLPGVKCLSGRRKRSSVGIWTSTAACNPSSNPPPPFLGR